MISYEDYQDAIFALNSIISYYEWEKREEFWEQMVGNPDRGGDC